MTTFTQNSNRPFHVLGEVLHGTLQTTALGTSGGTLFGVLFGLIATVLPGMPWTVAGLAGYFAVSGGCAGFIVGLCGTLFEGEPVPECSAPVLTVARGSPGSARHQDSSPSVSAGKSWRRHNRLAAYMKAKRIPTEAVRKPSRN